MTTSFRTLLVSSFVFATSLCAGCGLEPMATDADEADGAAMALGTRSQSLVSTTGITVTATYQEVVTGTPTYGDPATSPMLRVHVEVSDAALRAAYPSFDGLERVFVRVPKVKSGVVTWESQPLRYSGQSRRGYYGEIVIDLHDSDSIWGVDWPTLSRHGIAIGLDTNLGVIWAQEDGHNFAVTRR
ncbi:hypothetical protein [Haliangium sp. UPWRP_2]|uniref:hypothetical protein n=1 Tax=Haliangium sp. UPWRP_2 TaxID=1931276 RepID=UPI000B5476AD|nr:hypothetical protein [Haliangium sp. UPWRP_2]PSM30743.1 hypothetical protein BVG81_008940 [Haliangium sp. UPWRP_2]